MFEVRFYRDAAGRTPAYNWLNTLPLKARLKGHSLLIRLKELGNNLHRPYADYLRDGIYELRWKELGVNYRLLYFFNGHQIIVVSHGLVKEGRVPDVDIQKAIQRKLELEHKRE